MFISSYEHRKQPSVDCRLVCHVIFLMFVIGGPGVFLSWKLTFYKYLTNICANLYSLQRPNCGIILICNSSRPANVKPVTKLISLSSKELSLSFKDDRTWKSDRLGVLIFLGNIKPVFSNTIMLDHILRESLRNWVCCHLLRSLLNLLEGYIYNFELILSV